MCLGSLACKTAERKIIFYSIKDKTLIIKKNFHTSQLKLTQPNFAKYIKLKYFKCILLSSDFLLLNCENYHYL